MLLLLLLETTVLLLCQYKIITMSNMAASFLNTINKILQMKCETIQNQKKFYFVLIPLCPVFAAPLFDIYANSKENSWSSIFYWSCNKLNHKNCQISWLQRFFQKYISRFSRVNNYTKLCQIHVILPTNRQKYLAQLMLAINNICKGFIIANDCLYMNKTQCFMLCQ